MKYAIYSFHSEILLRIFTFCEYFYMHSIFGVQVIALNKNQRKLYSHGLHKIFHPKISSKYCKIMSLYGNYVYV